MSCKMKKNELGQEVQGRVAAKFQPRLRLQLIMFIEDDGKTNCSRKTGSLSLKGLCLSIHWTVFVAKKLLTLYMLL